MTSQVIEGTWICTDGYGRLRGEWVNMLQIIKVITGFNSFFFFLKTKQGQTQKRKANESVNRRIEREGKVGFFA